MRDVTALVVQAQAGDREALARLVADVQDDIWRLQRSRARSEADAEDATQETFARMIGSLGELRDPRAFAGWLVRIALNEANGAARRRGAEARAADALAAAASTFQENREGEAMERAELRESVRRAVGGLEPNLRTAVELRYEHGMSYADIARAMECPEGTVADRLHTAHERLRKVLAGAGVALALAALESELAAAPAGTAPAGLGKRLARLAREAPMGGEGSAVPQGPRPRAVAVLLGLAAILAGIAAWRIGRAPAMEPAGTAQGTAAAATSAGGRAETGPGPSAGTAGTSSTSVTHSPPTLGRVRGRILDAGSGEPVADAIVSATFQGDRARQSASVSSDARGNWSLELEPGEWVLEVRAADFVVLSTSADLERWRAREEGREPVEDYREETVSVAAGAESSRDLHLRRGVRVRGRVTDDRGTPLAGVTVRFFHQWIAVGPWPRAGFFHQGYLPEVLISDVEGRFAFGGVWPDGEISVRLAGDGLVTREVNLAVGGEEQVVQMERAAAIAGSVLDAFGKPLAGARFFGLADSANDSGNLEEVPVAVDDLGRFEIPPGAAGSRLLVVWAPGHGLALVDLAQPKPGRLDVRLPEASAVIRGRVRDARGFPIAGARVQIASVGGRTDGHAASLAFRTPQGSWHWPDGQAGGCLPGDVPVPATVTGADGTFRLEGVAVGAGLTAEISVRAPGFERELVAADASREIEVELQPEEE
ncbi:MAG: sigma-70 family RNA polymerase sigma factor [Planctomycetes bacterium]|nr:sigma-70 family RNA polymerase sigma factor [Planctomycetota bacterium]